MGSRGPIAASICWTTMPHPAPQAPVRTDATAVVVTSCRCLPPPIEMDERRRQAVGGGAIAKLAVRIQALSARDIDQHGSHFQFQTRQHPNQPPRQPPISQGWALLRPHSDLGSLTQHSNRRSDRRPHVCAWPTATDVQLAAPATCVGTNLWLVVPSPSCPA